MRFIYYYRLKAKRLLLKKRRWTSEYPDRAIALYSLILSTLFTLFGLAVAIVSYNVSKTAEDVTIDQYNMSAFQFNMEQQKRLESVMYSYNSVMYHFADMQTVLIYHKLLNQGKIQMRNRNVQERLDALNYIQNHLQELPNLDDLVPDKGMAEIYNVALNNVLQARLVYIENMALGYKSDTSSIGQQSYTEVINSVIFLEDTVLKSIEPERTKLFKQITDGAENLKEFAKENKKKQEEMRKNRDD